MAHVIDFQNLTQTQNNQSLMEEVENQDMKKTSEHFYGRNKRKSARSRFLSGQ